MDIICRQCNTTYSIPENKIPKKKATAKCKRCGYQMVIHDASPSKKQTTPLSTVPEAAPAAVPQQGDNLLADFPEMADFKTAQYDLPEIFKPNKKGSYRIRLNKLKVKILTTIKTKLDQILQPDERVMRVAAGTAYYPLEIFLGNGALTMLYNRYAMIATNQRLLLINTNHRMTHVRHYFYQMPYEDIKKVKRGLFRTSVVLTPKQGKRRVFTSMKPAFSKEVFDYIRPLLDPEKNISSMEAFKTHLCPACFSALGNKLTGCSSCQADFKKPAGAAWRSLLLPGLGDLYLGHRFLGCCEMVGAFLIWCIAFVFVTAGSTEMVVLAAMMLFFYNGFDALLTLHMGKKGYILAKR